MNLNSRDKLILVVVLVVVIWIAGVVSFIKPAIEDVKAAQNTLDSKEVELAEKQQQIEEDKDLPERIDAAYKKANETGKVFYIKMDHQHDAATEMQSRLDVDGDSSNGQEISQYSAVNLNRYIYNPSTVSTTLDAIMAPMEEVSTESIQAGDAPILSAYTFSLNFTATKADLIQFLENLQSSEHKSLVVQSLSIGSVGDNEDDTEWTGSMSLTLYMIPQLKDPEEVRAKIESGDLVVEVGDIAN